MSTIDSLLVTLKTNSIAIFHGSDEAEILQRFETIHEEDTMVAGPIRILSGDIGTVVMEYPNDGTGSIVLHLSGTLEEAKGLVHDRLSTYERMWDGCGCKINYYESAR